MKPPPAKRRFRIVHIGKRGETLTVVRATDAADALDRYCRERQVPEQERARLMAVPLE